MCTSLNVLVTTDVDRNTVSVYDLSYCTERRGYAQDGGANHGSLGLKCTFGGPSSAAPMQFQFKAKGDVWSGWTAFTGSASNRLLLVTDGGHDAVHVIDVVANSHKGYLVDPGMIPCPVTVAAAGGRVAVTSYNYSVNSTSVRMYEGGEGTSWTPLWFLHPRELSPAGLLFSGRHLLVCDSHKNRLVKYHKGTWSCDHDIQLFSRACHAVEWRDGWLVASDLLLEFVPKATGTRWIADHDMWTSCREDPPQALAVVPGMGVLMRHTTSVRMLVTPEAGAAMNAGSPAINTISATRVAWTTAVARAGRRKSVPCARVADPKRTCLTPPASGSARPSN